jgi:hypothetical protein
MLIIALQLDVSTSKLYAVAIWRLMYVSLVVCCDVMARLLTLFLLAGSLYRRNIRRWHVKIIYFWESEFSFWIYFRIVPSPIFQHGGLRMTGVGSSAGTPLGMWDTRHFTLTLTLPDTPNLCPSRTDISTLHKQFLQRSVCLSFCTWVFGVCVVSISSAFYGERRMKKVKKTERQRERERQRAKRQIFPFSVHLAAIGDINDRSVSVDQSRRKLHHSPDGTILK